MIHADPGVPCTVGGRVTVGHRVILHGCLIEDDCLIGMGAILLNGVSIGTGSVIGAGAWSRGVRRYPPGSLVRRLARQGRSGRWTTTAVPESTASGGTTSNWPDAIAPVNFHLLRRTGGPRNSMM